MSGKTLSSARKWKFGFDLTPIDPHIQQKKIGDKVRRKGNKVVEVLSMKDLNFFFSYFSLVSCNCWYNVCNVVSLSVVQT